MTQGDSGGPAFQQVNGRNYLFGVTSFGSSTFVTNTCYKSNIAVCMQVSKFVNWIDDTINMSDNLAKGIYSTKCF